METRNKKELIPLILAFMSAAIAFNLITEVGLYCGMILGVLVGVSGATYGWIYANSHGRNALVFFGVVACILLAIFESTILLISYLFDTAY